MDSFGKRGLWAKVQKLYNIHPERNQQDDLTVVGVKGVKDELILLASCYMPHDSEAPTAELHRLAVTSSDRRQALVMGADANAHHTIWGSPDINQRERFQWQECGISATTITFSQSELVIDLKEDAEILLLLAH
ncbi:uncharacterized protein LOC105220444 isoform X2 [Zeugodacus cucurbitae]|uniref:uncharacterized protein LOC105220444 isoform X2 n=1 Tax=Zeugodacus cucurbitae TaxID=28588 RepID=UPI0023D9328D|nr:uncharacterized protein LOC105220444 isoform X2 [Zeugodacus cucurbitae]